jgi:SWI/SNF-related matrix-associated actin-dependent regulator of chromatin subfamily D
MQPVQYKLTSKLARLLGIHTAKRPDIINAVWQYIRSNRLQDSTEREYINNDKYFQQVLNSEIVITIAIESITPRQQQ